jgi:hypothetical protein
MGKSLEEVIEIRKGREYGRNYRTIVYLLYTDCEGKVGVAYMKTTSSESALRLRIDVISKLRCITCDPEHPHFGGQWAPLRIEPLAVEPEEESPSEVIPNITAQVTRYRASYSSIVTCLVDTYLYPTHVTVKDPKKSGWGAPGITQTLGREYGCYAILRIDPIE